MNHRVFGILTAREGSKSVRNKNIIDVDGMPLFYHNVLEANKTKNIEKLYITTNSEFIKNYDTSYEVIARPEYLCTDDASHHETMIHAIEAIEKKENCKADIVVILLGNANGATAYDLDKSIEILKSNNQFDSVLSISEFNMFNPFRAYRVDDNGLLDTIMSQEQIIKTSVNRNINDKKSAGNCYFFNGAFMVCRRDSILKKEGKLPFPWLGNNIYPYVMDVVMELDAPWQVFYMNKRV